MRKNLGPKPLLFPQPVLIVAAYDIDGKPNAMNVAWGGVSDSHHVTMCLSGNHKTVSNILITGAFTISIGTVSSVIACDYLGIVSGNNEQNKLEKAGLTTSKSEFVNAPIINELPFTLECKLVSYNRESGKLIGEIVNVSVDEEIMTKEKIDIQKFQPICYDPANHYYLRIGEKVGDAFEDGEKLK